MTQEAGAEPTAGKRERSTISFPYGDLNSAVNAAKVVHEMGGGSCQQDQLAAWLHYSSVDNGAFRQQANTARIFGLTTLSRKVINLTPLGYRIVDSEQESAARVDAFLTVPLYAEIFREYQGKTLPSSVAGMESALARMGVAQKQTDKARQAFQRSAQQAGFFDAGKDRLVKPSLISPNSGEANEAEAGQTAPPPATTSTSLEDESSGAQHPLIQGLIVTLPAPGSQWSDTERKEWLTAAEHIFALIYSAERLGLPSPKPDTVEQAAE